MDPDPRQWGSVPPPPGDGRFRVPAGLVLAAGAGRRFGGPKALVELEGRLLVERGVDLLQSAGCMPCVVVLGAAAARVRRRADLSGALVVHAPQWQRGQSESLAAGLVELSGSPAPAVVVTLVDQPLVTPAVIRRLVRRWRGGAEAVVATYDGRPRTPVLLARTVWEEVAASLGGDRGAGPWLRSHPERVTPVEVGDLADDLDVDEPDDLAAVRQRLRPI